LRFAILVFAALIILPLLQPYYKWKAQEGIEGFWKKAGEGRFKEDVVPVDVRLADVDSDGSPDVVILWGVMGPTYWSYHLSILRLHDGKYSEAVRHALRGIPKTMKIERGAVVLGQRVPQEGDGRCCPSDLKLFSYRWNGSTHFDQNVTP
jgi:hypothetical protein